jgi:hypothetical protein
MGGLHGWAVNHFLATQAESEGVPQPTQTIIFSAWI